MVKSSHRARRKVRIIFSEVKMEHDRCRGCSYKLNFEKCLNNVFRSKEPTKNVPPDIFRGFEVRKKVRLMFGKPQKDSMRVGFYVLRE